MMLSHAIRLSEHIIKNQSIYKNLENNYIQQQNTFSSHSLQVEESTPPVLALPQTSENGKLVNGPFMLIESFIPLLKMVVKMMEKMVKDGKTAEYTVNQMRLNFLNVRNEE